MARGIFSLHCGTWDTFLVVECRIFVEACGIQFPDQGSNLGPLLWEHGVSSIGPPGKSVVVFFSSLPFNQSRKYAGTLSNFVKSQRWHHQDSVQAW